MRVLVWLTLLVGFALAGNWGVSAYIARDNVIDILDTRPELEGRMGHVSGFPHAVLFTLSDLRWHVQSENLHWDLGAVDVNIPLFPRRQIHLSFPEQQIMQMADRVFVLESDEIGADLDLGRDQMISGLRVKARQLSFDPATVVQSAEAITVQMDDLGDYTYRIQGMVEGVRLASDILHLEELAGADPLTLSIDANLTFVSSMAMDQTLPQLHEIEISAIDLDGLPATMALEGAVVRNSAGLFDGRLNLTASDWQTPLDALIRSGVIAPELRTMIAALLGSQSDPATGRLDLPLSVADSAIRLGPFVIATLPRW